jgi:hypothetical protein
MASVPGSLLKTTLLAVGATLALGVALAGCGGAASTQAPGGPASGAPGAAATATAATATAAAATQAAAMTADPAVAGAVAKLNGLTSYKFKLTVKGGSYASSVGAAGVAGTVVNKPSFAVHFTYADLEIIEVTGKNWTRNGSSWDLSPYGNLPTTYDSYGPAIQLSRFFDASVTPYYTAVGDETVNGVLATHFVAKPQILNFMIATWGVTAANGKADGLVQAGDIWIARDGGYPVRWKVTATGGVAGPGSGGSSDFEYLLDITKANDAANVVSVPAS